MGRERPGMGLGMGEFASLFLFNYSLPVPCFALEDSGYTLTGRF